VFIPKKKVNVVNRLLKECKKYQGEYLPTNHGSGSWATTYSREFLKASTELYKILVNAKSPWPLDDLSTLFIENKIPSCRGTKMTPDKVEYLFNKHIKHNI